MVGWKFRIFQRNKRFFTYSLTLSIEEIEWLRAKEDAPAFVRKLFDDVMNTESKATINNEVARLKAEAAELREHANLLEYKWKALCDQGKHEEAGLVNGEKYKLVDRIHEIRERLDDLEPEVDHEKVGAED
jgi:hypothetical protein